MKIIEQSHEILHMDSIERLEIAGRTCYKSEDKITHDSAKAFVKKLIKRNHTAMIEHGSATIKFITDRGVTHEIVRHRIASYGQESTRYVNYSGDDIAFILPVWLPKTLLGFYDLEDNLRPVTSRSHMHFVETCLRSEQDYKELCEDGWRPEQARGALNHFLKTEIVVTMDFRSWRHFFDLRALGTTGKPHPQMQALALGALRDCAILQSAVFEDQYLAALDKNLY